MLIKKKYICPYCETEIEGKIACGFCCKILKHLINLKNEEIKHCSYIAAPFIYKSIIRDAILKFKFEKRKEFCKSFCHFMIFDRIKLFDLLVCVPTFEKEFNSSKELSKVLSKKIKIHFCENAVIKIRKTKHQHNCSLKERLTNLKGAFKADENKVCGKHILICDDIITTKSTIKEIAFSLKKAGAKSVGAVSFAISQNLPFQNID